ncbi:MAG: hypothetical protein QOD68_2848, partial [Actinomycetota bacterium]|nr:hypothetical protein [Actinomycetota bacterium]
MGGILNMTSSKAVARLAALTLAATAVAAIGAA